MELLEGVIIFTCFISVSFITVCGGERPYLAPDQLEKEHKPCIQSAMEQFHATCNKGGEQCSQTYADKLEEDLLKAFESRIWNVNMKHIKQRKQIFLHGHTPNF